MSFLFLKIGEIYFSKSINFFFSLYPCSIVVSTLNSIATVTWEDFLSPLNLFSKRSDRYQLVFIKSLGVIYAFLTMGIAFLVSMFSGVIEISMFVNAATSGTLVGVFILAMLIPFANSKVNLRTKQMTNNSVPFVTVSNQTDLIEQGAAAGMVVSHLVIIALSTTSFLSNNLMEVELLPTSIEVNIFTTINCHIKNNFEIPL